MKRIALFANISLFAIIASMAIQLVTTYAVVPGKYSKETYSNEEVRAIVLHERSDGMKQMRSMLEVNMLIFVLVGIPVSILNIFVIERSSKSSSG